MPCYIKTEFSQVYIVANKSILPISTTLKSRQQKIQSNSKIAKSYPVVSAILMKPFFLASFKLNFPGKASNASNAPPTTRPSAFPVPCFVRRNFMLSDDASTAPIKNSLEVYVQHKTNCWFYSFHSFCNYTFLALTLIIVEVS